MRAKAFGALLSVGLALAGCGDDGSSSETDSGGSGAAMAGTSAMAGSAATAGSAGSRGGAAGSASSGGASGAGGATSLGGRAGSAGAMPGGAAGAPASGAGSGGSPAGAGGAFGGAGAAGSGAAGGSELGGRAGASGAAGSAGAAGSGGATTNCGPVTAVPDAVRDRLDLDPFYEKHVDANGISVLASAKPSDESLLLACALLNNMLGERDDVRQALIRNRARFAIIGENEGTAEIPEYGYRDGPQSDIDYINQRARGLGGIVASCGEENILCLQGDRYRNESICVHEFSHTISMYGTYSADDDFEDDLEAAYEAALDSGILDNTYRNSNLQEYWAEGVQDWYDTNDFSDPPNGIHNEVNTRVELADFDPTLYALVAAMFPESIAWGDCHAE